MKAFNGESVPGGAFLVRRRLAKCITWKVVLLDYAIAQWDGTR
jgi:hypothetical protein